MFKNCYTGRATVYRIMYSIQLHNITYIHMFIIYFTTIYYLLFGVSNNYPYIPITSEYLSLSGWS